MSADLTTLGLPRARAATLASLAAAVVADPQVLGAGRSLTECVTELRQLPGIGEWTAQYIAMRELREPDAFPAGDIGLLRALQDADGQRPTSRELLTRAERWRPWRAYAAQHLWASGASAATPSALLKVRRTSRRGRLWPGRAQEAASCLPAIALKPASRRVIFR